MEERRKKETQGINFSSKHAAKLHKKTSKTWPSAPFANCQEMYGEAKKLLSVTDSSQQMQVNLLIGNCKSTSVPNNSRKQVSWHNG